MAPPDFLSGQLPPLDPFSGLSGYGLPSINGSGGGGLGGLPSISAGGGSGGGLPAISSFGNSMAGLLGTFKRAGTSAAAAPGEGKADGISVTGSAAHRALIDKYAGQIAQQYGLDPGQLADASQALLEIESHGDPRAKSAAGASGLMQLMSVHFAAGEDPFDPETNIRRGMDLFAHHTSNNGSYDLGAAQYFGAYNPTTRQVTGAADVNGQTGQGYVQAFQNTHAAVRQSRQQPAPPAQTASDPGSGATVTLPPPRDLVPNQFTELPNVGDSGCGPAAAIAFARSHGANPSAADVMGQTGGLWDITHGMYGPAAMQELLDRLGYHTQLDQSGNLDAIGRIAASGRPVIISTGIHYYFVNGYDPASGKLFVGSSGAIGRKGGSAWMTAAEIARLDGGINGVLA